MCWRIGFGFWNDGRRREVKRKMCDGCKATEERDVWCWSEKHSTERRAPRGSSVLRVVRMGRGWRRRKRRKRRRKRKRRKKRKRRRRDGRISGKTGVKHLSKTRIEQEETLKGEDIETRKSQSSRLVWDVEGSSSGKGTLRLLRLAASGSGSGSGSFILLRNLDLLGRGVLHLGKLGGYSLRGFRVCLGVYHFIAIGSVLLVMLGVRHCRADEAQHHRQDHHTKVQAEQHNQHKAAEEHLEHIGTCEGQRQRRNERRDAAVEDARANVLEGSSGALVTRPAGVHVRVGNVRRVVHRQPDGQEHVDGDHHVHVHPEPVDVAQESHVDGADVQEDDRSRADVCQKDERDYEHDGQGQEHVADGLLVDDRQAFKEEEGLGVCAGVQLGEFIRGVANAVHLVEILLRGVGAFQGRRDARGQDRRVVVAEVNVVLEALSFAALDVVEHRRVQLLRCGGVRVQPVERGHAVLVLEVVDLPRVERDGELDAREVVVLNVQNFVHVGAVRHEPIVLEVKLEERDADGTAHDERRRGQQDKELARL
eukprot:scaffold11_cov257-Pinguiococcus_pyrenoidosus.AAC.8